MINKITTFFKSIYTQFIAIDDSPQRIAIGFGVGVFLGILPGTGPLAAVGVAYLFRINKTAAFLGGLLTNAWLSVVTFVLALKIGAWILKEDPQLLVTQAKELMNHFDWNKFWDVSLGHIVLPLTLGYVVVGFVCGVLSYAVVLIILKLRKG